VWDDDDLSFSPKKIRDGESGVASLSLLGEAKFLNKEKSWMRLWEGGIPVY